jgi:hypothetical protein
VSGVLVSKEKSGYFFIIGGIFGIFPLFIDAVLGYRRLAS